MTKKDQILESALALLIENGIHATPMSAIAKKAKTGMGTIYNYFPTKEDLINEIYVNIKVKEMHVLLQFDEQEPIKTQFETFYKSMLMFFLKRPDYFYFMEQLQASPLINEKSKKKGEKAVACGIQLIELGKQNRIIKNIETEEIIQFLGGSVMSFIRWQLSQNKKPNLQALNNHLEMVWSAIKE